MYYAEILPGKATNEASYGDIPVEIDLMLVRAAQRGDLGAFNALVERYQRSAYGIAYRMLANREGAEDATQEAFLSAYTALHRFTTGSFKAWLFRIVINECIDQLRKVARAPQTFASLTGDDEDESFEPVSADAPPEDYALSREMLAHLQHELQELPAGQRMVVILSDLEGFSYKEIAAVTGVSLNVVKTRLHRARKALRKRLLRRPETCELLAPHHLAAG